MTVFSRGAPPEGRPERKHHFERGVNKAFYRKGLNVGRFFVPARGSEKKGEEIGIARFTLSNPRVEIGHARLLPRNSLK